MSRAKADEGVILMDKATENSLREKQLSSQGRLLSSFSHDLKNHLAIINESTGLLQDYIEMGRIPDKELAIKLEEILKRLDGRTAQITEMAHHLNNFAHRSDTPSSSFDLNKLMLEQLFFLHRSARLKKISLAIRIPASEMQINSNPALLQFAFLQLFDATLKQLQENDQLEISTQQEKETVGIRLSLKSGSPLSSAFDFSLNTPELQLCLKKLAARVATDSTSTTSYEMFLTLSAVS